MPLEPPRPSLREIARKLSISETIAVGSRSSVGVAFMGSMQKVPMEEPPADKGPWGRLA